MKKENIVKVIVEKNEPKEIVAEVTIIKNIPKVNTYEIEVVNEKKKPVKKSTKKKGYKNEKSK